MTTLETVPSLALEPRVSLDGVTVRYGDVVGLDRLDLDLAEGELLAVVGPSGCGKSTLLRAVAGLQPIDAGRVAIGRDVVADDGRWVPAERRGVGVVFQDHALFPHLDVAANVGFGLARAGDRADRVAEVLELVGLVPLAHRYPHELSGGEQQRVALARALAPRPSVLLLDEPFSSLDRNLRARVRAETTELLRRLEATAVFVTHDQGEALAVGDRVAVMRDGRVAQVDAPDVVYHAPTSRFVATFLDEADLLPARRHGSRAATRFGDVEVAGPEADGDVEVMVRPHEVVLTVDAHGEARVSHTEFRGGAVAHVVAMPDGTTVRGLRPHTDVLPIGTSVRVTIDARHPVATFSAGGGEPSR